MATNYPDDFDPESGYDRALAPDHDFPMLARDLNAANSIQAYRTKTIGDALYRDGAVDSGGGLYVDRESGEARVDEAGIYLDGMVRHVPAASFTIPLGQVIKVGICYERAIVTHLEDPGLVNQIVGSETYGEPAQHRGKGMLTWTHSGLACQGNFYAVYEVSDGIVIDQTPPPQLSPINTALARYDREKNGNYIVSGWRTRALGLVEGKQCFTIGEGTINVWGDKTSREASLRLFVDEEPDLDVVEAEPHQVPSDATGRLRLICNHLPVVDVGAVTVTRQREVDLTHGPFSGVSDPLPDTSVAEIVSVSQGETVYAEGPDYSLASDQVIWLADGEEPAPGSTYHVVYRYLDTGAPDDWDENGVWVSDAVPGSTAIIAYHWALPRIDAISVDRNGNVHYLKGVSSRYQPWPPSVANDHLRIALIANKWGSTPTVQNTDNRAVHNNELVLHRDMIADIYELLAHERLKRNMDSRQPTTKLGVFVDPLLDDDMRDQGLEQTGAIVDGYLQLGIEASISDHVLGTEPFLLPFVEEEVIVQDLVTGCHLINPYQMFEPLPARVALDPAVDIWTETRTEWASDVTRRFTTTATNTLTARGGIGGTTTSVSTSSTTTRSSEFLGSTTEDASEIRVRDVGFSIDGFGAGEILDQATFDGLDVTDSIGEVSLVADEDGHVEGQFTIPEGVPTGSKPVGFTGRGGTRGSATYVGQGVIETETWRNVFTTRIRRTITTTVAMDIGGDGGGADPVAQTFALQQGRHISGVSVQFCAIGDRSNPVALSLRGTDNGEPVREIYGDSVIEMGDIETDVWTKIPMASRPYLSANTRFAHVLMTDDAEHAVAVAQRGEFDREKQQFVTAQPYNVGIFFDGSLDEAWKPHHDKDMAFKLHAPRFTAALREVVVGDIELVECSDLIVSCGFDEPTADCSVTVKLVRASGEVIRAQPGVPVQFDSYLSETVAVSIELRGTELASPTLYPFVQIVQGRLREDGDYISRAMPANGGADMNLVCSFDCLLPAGSDVDIFFGTQGNWQPAQLHSAEALGDGWQSRNYKLENYRAADARFKLVYGGNPKARPLIASLNANVTPDPINIITGS